MCFLPDTPPAPGATALHYSTLTDEDLMPLVGQDDPQALAAVYGRHSALVFAICMKFLGDREEARDASQDVFLRCLQNAWRFDSTRGRVAGWLATIARNRCLDLIRSRNRRGEGNARFQEEAATEHLLEPTPVDPDETRIVRLALQSLPAAQRELVVLAFFEGRSQSEIADRLGQPLGTVKSRIRRGLLRLREILVERTGDEFSRTAAA